PTTHSTRRAWVRSRTSLVGTAIQTRGRRGYWSARVIRVCVAASSQRPEVWTATARRHGRAAGRARLGESTMRTPAWSALRATDQAGARRARRSVSMSERFDGKVVVITGAAGGIGRATAVRFAWEGARVVLVDLASAPLDNAVAAV